MSRRSSQGVAIVLCLLGIGYAVYKLVLLAHVDARGALLLVLALAALIVVFLLWGRKLMAWLKNGE